MISDRVKHMTNRQCEYNREDEQYDLMKTSLLLSLEELESL